MARVRYIRRDARAPIPWNRNSRLNEFTPVRMPPVAPRSIQVPQTDIHAVTKCQTEECLRSRPVDRRSCAPSPAECPWRKRHIKWPFGNRLTFSPQEFHAEPSRTASCGKSAIPRLLLLQCATQDKSLKENIRGTFTVVPGCRDHSSIRDHSSLPASISSRRNIAFNIAAERYRHYLTL